MFLKIAIIKFIIYAVKLYMGVYYLKIRMLNSRNEINRLGEDENFIHFSFRPSDIDILEILKHCPNLKAAQIPPSYMKSLSGNVPKILKMQGVELLKGDLKGTKVIKYMEVIDK
ncbi:hypothetical protein BKM01_09555 [Methanohalophilus portucalensis]|uniref:DUF1699 domain-containing protein n=3 Tax=Methanohalophilus portucalensis TaxID=39664 RepID=A0A2D3C689_9EURY|nr:hypothetical protein BKM01_09555 [Methanohalophilus portucalensis]